jgi:acetate CoA/acetoacetate CoA-transferase alpha subunit
MAMLAKPLLTAAEAMARARDGMTVLVPGFLACGTPETLIDALIVSGVANLTAVCNDSAHPDRGIGKLIRHRRLRRFITTHQGTNPDMRTQTGGTGIAIELVPQGTLVERLRAAGAGLGGVLTPTGLGTPVEQGKRKIEIDGRPYLLETPLRGDLALIRAETADRAGNLTYRHTARNFNPVMATAADWVVAEVAHIVEPGELDPDRVETPGLFVDVLVLR